MFIPFIKMQGNGPGVRYRVRSRSCDPVGGGVLDAPAVECQFLPVARAKGRYVSRSARGVEGAAPCNSWDARAHTVRPCDIIEVLRTKSPRLGGR